MNADDDDGLAEEEDRSPISLSDVFDCVRATAAFNFSPIVPPRKREQ